MTELDADGRRLLDWLVEQLQVVLPNRTATYVSYSDAHDALHLPLVGKTHVASLQLQGLNALAEWTKSTGKPGITGLLIDRGQHKPALGYFKLFGKTPDDLGWWSEEIRLTKEFDWMPHVSPAVRKKLAGSSPARKVAAAAPTPQASDLAEPPARIGVEVYRVLRDTPAARRVKELHGHSCQICRATILLADGLKYSEAHHIKPLGGDHRGLDVPENILSVCPNHHVLLDFGVLELRIGNLVTVPGHAVGPENVRYHNEVLLRTGK